MKTIPFDLEAAKKGAKLVTRKGRTARIICFDKNSNIFPIVALVKDNEGNEYPSVYTDKGHYFSDNRTTVDDLFILEEPQYVPYESAEEFMQAQKEHGPYLCACNQYKLPILVDNTHTKGIVLGSTTPRFYDYEHILDSHVWQDGTPCGKLKGGGV